MHQYKQLFQPCFSAYIREYRKKHNVTQEKMAERLRITPRSYAYLEAGTYACSATTLMFFLLIISEKSVVTLLAQFRTLVDKEDEHVVP